MLVSVAILVGALTVLFHEYLILQGAINSSPDHFPRSIHEFSGNGQPQVSLTNVPNFVSGRGVQVHTQTIDILVAEKSKLVQELAQTRAQLQTCQSECLCMHVCVCVP